MGISYLKIPCLSREDKEVFDPLIEELQQAVLVLTNESPKADGLPVEVYRK